MGERKQEVETSSMGQHIYEGCTGKILRVNLSDHTTSIETTGESLCRNYIGGAGFVSYFLWKELEQRISSLSPFNKLIFATGPLTGIPIPGGGRHCVGAKSPLSEGIAKSESGGFWGTELKRTGFDAIIIEGKAEKPVYLWLHNGEVHIRDASHLWGKNTKETLQAIKAELGENRIRVAAIGPGGENNVRFACIINDLSYVTGRGGLGSVMGSKNLKAIAVRGDKAPQISNLEAFKNLKKSFLVNFQKNKFLNDLHEFGTGFKMEEFEATGNLPVRNFRDGIFPGFKKIDSQAIKNSIRVRMDSCFSCPVRCRKTVQFDEPYSVDLAYGGPEYETLAAIGSNCGIDNLKAIAKGHELCNAYSLDTISVGGVIAWAMECFENGLLTIKDTDGIELRFGNDEAMLKMIELIARREGIGDLLAEGTARASQKVGKGASELAMQVKCVELGMHEPRFKPGLGLGYMVNPHGADHCCNLHDDKYLDRQQIEELKPFGIFDPVPLDDISPLKVKLFKAVHLKRIIFDSLVLCQFLPYTYEQVADLLKVVTGCDMDLMELSKAAERILTTARLFNIREGLTSASDTLPMRFFEGKRDGPLADKPLDRGKMEKAKMIYYSLMGWDERTGIPPPEKPEDLSIM